MQQTAIDGLNDRNTRRVPSVPDVVNHVPPVYVFNVSATAFVASSANREFIIPACPAGAKVSPALVIPGVVQEFFDQGTDTAGLALWNGTDVARDVVGISSADKGLGTYTSNHEWHGVFISDKPTPTNAQIEAANVKHNQLLDYLIAEADSLHLKGPKGQEEINISHRAAARERNVKRTWSEKVVAQDNCPACGGDILPGVAVCRHCNAVLDETKARQFFPGRFDVKEPEATPAQTTMPTQQRR